MDQWEFFYRVQTMSIVSAHLSLGRLPLFYIYHQSVVVCTTMIKLHFSLYALRVGQRECCVFFLFFLFVRTLACSLALMVVKREKKYSSTTVRYTYMHITHSVAKYKEKAVFLFFFLSFFSFLQCAVWVDVMLQGSKSGRHDAWCIRMQEKNLVSITDMHQNTFFPMFWRWNL
jgi:hypothetical protein